MIITDENLGPSFEHTKLWQG